MEEDRQHGQLLRQSYKKEVEGQRIVHNYNLGTCPASKRTNRWDPKI
jgi:hypothetical protein